MLKALSRRTFLQFTAAGSAAALPVAAEAAFPNVEAVPLSDEQALDACIGQLKNILARMHPAAKPAYHHIGAQGDGGFYLHVKAEPAYQQVDGDGFYLVSMQGHPVPYWLEETLTRSMTGAVINRHFWAYQWIENDFDGGEMYFAEPRYVGEPSIISKLDMPPGKTLDDIPFNLARY
jgi:hypothetical protein